MTTTAILIVSFDADRVTLRVDCSAGFYVRSLAHDLGERLGIGAHLVALRRTRSGDVTLDDALPLEVAERDPAQAAARLLPLARMLPGLPAVTLTPDGVERAVHGRDIGPGFVIRASGFDWPDEPRIPSPESRQDHVRLLDEAGSLVAIARPSSIAGSLHPSIVLM